MPKLFFDFVPLDTSSTHCWHVGSYIADMGRDTLLTHRYIVDMIGLTKMNLFYNIKKVLF